MAVMVREEFILQLWNLTFRFFASPFIIFASGKNSVEKQKLAADAVWLR